MYSKKMTRKFLISTMDRSIKRMLKLIEEDGDSFAKKAEMYYQRRPELISLVEEFYRMYRSLAERFDHVTVELKKNTPSDLQSQASGISDAFSELPSTWPSPGPDQKLTWRKSGPSAAGFEFFLGSGGSSNDLFQKELDESSTLTDSEPESDDSSVNNDSGLFGNGGDQGITRKMIELEIELRETKEKLLMQQDENGDGLVRAAGSENIEDLARNAVYDQELRISNERLRSSEEKVARLKSEIEKYQSSELVDGFGVESALSKRKGNKAGEVDPEDDIIHETETSMTNSNVWILEEELRTAKERLQGSEKEIASLKSQIEAALNDINTWESKLNTEKKKVAKLQEKINRLKVSLSDHDLEIKEMKAAVSDAEKIFLEKAEMKNENLKLLAERASMDEQIKEWESRGRALEDKIRTLHVEKMEAEKRLYFKIEQAKADMADRDSPVEHLVNNLHTLNSERDMLKAELVSRDDWIGEMDKQLQLLHIEHVQLIVRAEQAGKQVDELRSKAKELEEEVERQGRVLLEAAEEKREAIRQLCFSLEHYRNGYHMLRRAFSGNKRVPVLAA